MIFLCPKGMFYFRFSWKVIIDKEIVVSASNNSNANNAELFSSSCLQLQFLRKWTARFCPLNIYFEYNLFKVWSVYIPPLFFSYVDCVNCKTTAHLEWWCKIIHRLKHFGSSDNLSLIEFCMCHFSRFCYYSMWRQILDVCNLHCSQIFVTRVPPSFRLSICLH